MKLDIRVAVIVVTYNRKRLLERCLNSLFKETVLPQKIFVIDNASTDGTCEYLESFQQNNKKAIEYIRLSNNIGGSGGFHRGFLQALKTSGWDWLLVMDDDAAPAPNYIEKLLEKSGEFSNVKAFIGTEYVGDSNRISYGGRRIIDREETMRAKIVPKEMYKKDVFYVDTVTFVGLMMHRSVVEKAGCPDDSFFIYYDDTDYCLKLRPYTRILLVVGARIVHRENFEKDVVDESKKAWRRYYLFRNETVIKKRYIKKWYYRYGWIFKNYLRTVKEILTAKGSKAKNLRLITKATADALFNHLGKAESVHE